MTYRFWKIRNEHKDSGEILLYGPIAGDANWLDDEVTPKEFASDLASFNGKDITVRINSGGGDVFAANAIYNLLSSYTGKVTVKIDGLAASAATIVAMAGDRVIMPDNALFMIHNPVMGLNDYFEVDDLFRAIEALKKIKKSIMAAYRTRCHVSEKELAELMNAETWLNASECLEKGFIDEIEGSVMPVMNDNCLVVNNLRFSTANFKNINALKSRIKGEKKMSKLEEFLNSLGLKIADEKPIVQDTTKVIEAERKRIADLEAEECDNAAVSAIIAVAKQNGQTVQNIRPYINAVKAVKPTRSEAQKVVADMIADNNDSGVNNIKPGVIDVNAAEKASDLKALETMVHAMNKKFGGAK